MGLELNSNVTNITGLGILPYQKRREQVSRQTTQPTANQSALIEPLGSVAALRIENAILRSAMGDVATSYDNGYKAAAYELIEAQTKTGAVDWEDISPLEWAEWHTEMECKIALLESLLAKEQLAVVDAKTNAANELLALMDELQAKHATAPWRVRLDYYQYCKKNYGLVYGKP